MQCITRNGLILVAILLVVLDFFCVLKQYVIIDIKIKHDILRPRTSIIMRRGNTSIIMRGNKI